MTCNKTKITIIFIWTILFGLLIKKLYFQDYTKNLTYDNVIRKDLLFNESWYGIFYKDKQIGYVKTIQRSDEEKNTFTLHDSGRINIPIAGNVNLILFESKSFIDESYRLIKFIFKINSNIYKFSVSGHRIKDNLFEIVINTGTNKSTQIIQMPDKTFIYSLFAPTPINKLKIGETMNMKIFNPLTAANDDITIKALKKDSLKINNILLDCTVAEMTYKGIKSNAWISPGGRLLREINSLKWKLEYQTIAQINNYLNQLNKNVSFDFLEDFGITPDNKIRFRNPIKLKISGTYIDTDGLITDNQSLIEYHDSQYIIKINHPAISSNINTVNYGDEFNEYLSPSELIQSNHPKIKKTANDIIKNTKNKWEQVKKINRWIYKNIKKTYSLNVPSSIEILKYKKGDCNEHTYLFTALVRSINIPCRIEIGLVFLNGQYLYHSWPSVFLGKWIPLDPTLGQDVADIKHIRLFSGGLNKQLVLLNYLGKLKIMQM